MDKEALLLLATNLLNSPEGEKILGEIGADLDFDKIQKKLLREQSRLTREERRENRRERQEARRENREIKKRDRKRKILELKAQLKSNVPVLKEYNVSGRIFDKQTGNPIKGVKINIIEGFIPGENPKTDKNGKFSINLLIPVLPSEVTVSTTEISSEDNKIQIEETFQIRDKDVTILNSKLIYTASGYAPTTQQIITRNRSVKDTLNAISLINLDKAIQNTKDDINLTLSDAQQKVNTIIQGFPDVLVIAQRKSILNIIDIIKTRIIPLALGLLLVFGISKISQKNQKVCPSPEQLKNVIRRRNKVTRQLNQIFLALTANVALAAVFKALQNVFRGARSSISSLPIPLALGGPGQIGLIFSNTYSFVAKLEDVKETLKELEESNKELNKQLLTSIIFLIIAIVVVLILLQNIDNLTRECAKESGVDSNNGLIFEDIEEELLELTQENSEEGTSLTPSINGFILSIETEKDGGVGTLKRRFAVGKNKQGITLIKGEPSFSSSDQVLIDELIFYIKTNDLKAF